MGGTSRAKEAEVHRFTRRRSLRRTLRPTLGAAIIAGLLAGAVPAAAPAAPCPGNNTHVWFLGVVFDDAFRNDFILDVDNFESYKARLQETYCFPETQAEILAFKDNWSYGNKTYTAASERNVKDRIAAMGAAASQHSDSLFFFFLSSHGIAYPNRVCSGQRRVGGSLSALHSGSGQDGDLYDCELGLALNQSFATTTRMVVVVDCSLCGGFSDSLTAASGTIPDGSVPTSSGIPRPNRVVITGCAVTTECFGSEAGGVSYKHMSRVLANGVGACDGWTIPGFPLVQGINAPVKDSQWNGSDGRCTASEWLFAAVQSAYDDLDEIGIQQQFRLKYGFGSIADDVLVW